MDEDSSNYKPSNFYNILKTQLLKILNDFIREIDLSFDYICVNKTKTFIDSCQTNDIKFKDCYTIILNELKDIKDKLYLHEKTKTAELLFLNNVKLFDINFEVFKDESKNTKKTLVNYLKEFYITSNFLRCISELSDIDTDKKQDNSLLFNEIQDMIKTLTIEPNHTEIIRHPSSTITNKLPSMDNFTNKLPPMDNLLGTLNSFMNNKEIMNLTKELSSEIQMNDIDPMSMMNSLLSGNLDDSKFSGLLSKITDKISNKIQNGDIDKDLIERHANNFMSQISSNADLMNLANNFKK